MSIVNTCICVAQRVSLKNINPMDKTPRILLQARQQLVRPGGGCAKSRVCGLQISSGTSLHTSTQAKQKPSRVYESPNQSPLCVGFLCLTVLADMVSCSRGDEKVFTDCGWLKFHFYPTVNPAAIRSGCYSLPSIGGGFFFSTGFLVKG